VAALRAALVITSQREGKQKENPAYYKVVSVLFFTVAASLNEEITVHNLSISYLRTVGRVL